MKQSPFSPLLKSNFSPYLLDVPVDRRVNPEVFKDVNMLAECFDDPIMKAAALRAALTNMPGIGYVGASGLAGYGDNNAIQTQKIHDNVYHEDNV